jgi:polar amino acid transport system permease protein
LNSFNPKSPVMQSLFGAFLIALVGVLVWQILQGLKTNNIVLDWSVLGQPSQITNGSNFTTILLGMWLTIRIALVSIVLALLLGIVVGVSRLSSNTVVRLVATAYVEFFRNTPLLVQIFFWFFGVFYLLPTPLQQTLDSWFGKTTLLDGKVVSNVSEYVVAVVVALSVYTSSYIAETIRAGIQSISKGQSEAGLSLGLSGFQTLTKIVLPQALRVVIPPLGNQFLNLTKNSSLASQLGAEELFYYGLQMQNTTGQGFVSISAITLGYLVLSLTITAILALINRRFTLVVKK